MAAMAEIKKIADVVLLTMPVAPYSAMQIRSILHVTPEGAIYFLTETKDYIWCFEKGRAEPIIQAPSLGNYNFIVGRDLVLWSLGGESNNSEYWKQVAITCVDIKARTVRSGYMSIRSKDNLSNIIAAPNNQCWVTWNGVDQQTSSGSQPKSWTKFCLLQFDATGSLKTVQTIENPAASSYDIVFDDGSTYGPNAAYYQQPDTDNPIMRAANIPKDSYSRYQYREILHDGSIILGPNENDLTMHHIKLSKPVFCCSKRNHNNKFLLSSPFMEVFSSTPSPPFGSRLLIRFLKSPLPKLSTISFQKSNSTVEMDMGNMDAQYSFVIDFGATKLSFPQCFAELRCPGLLSANFVDKPIHENCVDMLKCYILSNTTPQPATATQLVEIAFLLREAGFESESKTILDQLPNVAKSLEDLCSVYSACYDLGFSAGLHACLVILRAKASTFDMTKMKDYLGDARAWNVASYLWNAELAAQQIATGRVVTQGSTLQQTLESLWISGKGADFDIFIGQTLAKKCHSFVLKARWPWAKRAIQAGMSEAVNKKITLRADEITPVLLNAILEVIYTGSISEETVQSLSAPEAINLVGIQRLYLESVEPEISKKIFSELIRYALAATEIMTPDNIAEIYVRACEAEIEDLKERAKGIMFLLWDHVKRSPKQRAALRTLPIDEQLDLLWDRS